MPVVTAGGFGTVHEVVNKADNMCFRGLRSHYVHRRGGLDRLLLKRLNPKRLEAYKNERGFEQIARDLGIPYPRRPREQTPERGGLL